jgi:hypothetical protein
VCTGQCSPTTSLRPCASELYSTIVVAIPTDTMKQWLSNRIYTFIIPDGRMFSFQMWLSGAQKNLHFTDNINGNVDYSFSGQRVVWNSFVVLYSNSNMANWL